MKKSKNFNLIYLGISSFYYLVHACFGAFGNLFMVDRGLEEATIGLVFSASSILALSLQVIISRVYDKKPNLNSKSILILVCFLTLGSIGGLYNSTNRLAIMMLFALAWALTLSLVPVLSSIFIEYKNLGYQISFNIPRASGSFFYALASIFIGKLLSKGLGSNLVLVIAAGSFFIVLCLAYLLPTIKKSTDMMLINEEEVLESISSPYEEERKNFKFLLLGIALVFIMHNIIGSYMLQFVENRGGSSNNVGLAMAISAFVEIPTLVFYSRLRNLASDKTLLFISSLGFTAKPLVVILTSTIGGLYLAQVIQIFGYALYVGAVIGYTYKILVPAQAVLAQFYVNIALTLGGITGNICGGYLFQYYGPKQVVLFGLTSSVLGLVFFALGLKGRPTSKKS